jgi:hypothetical protein
MLANDLIAYGLPRSSRQPRSGYLLRNGTAIAPLVRLCGGSPSPKPEKAMSALCLKADVCIAAIHGSYVPGADITVHIEGPTITKN